MTTFKIVKNKSNLFKVEKKYQFNGKVQIQFSAIFHNITLTYFYFIFLLLLIVLNISKKLVNTLNYPNY